LHYQKKEAKMLGEEASDKWNKRVAYFFDESIGSYNYANGHPMKPLRVAMTDTLIKSYEIDTKLNRFVKSCFDMRTEKNKEWLLWV